MLASPSNEASHHIPEGSCFDWPTQGKEPEMYGWKVTSAQALVVPQQGPDKKGMIGCKAITRVAVLRTSEVRLQREGGGRVSHNPSCARGGLVPSQTNRQKFQRMPHMLRSCRISLARNHSPQISAGPWQTRANGSQAILT